MRKRKKAPRALTAQQKAQRIAQRNAEWEDEEQSSESEEWYSGCEHDPRAYQKGGYLKVEPGQKLNQRYKIQRRLGWGHFAMVYLAKDLEYKDGSGSEFVALKIQKSSLDYQEAAEEEIPFLERVVEEMKKSEEKAEAPRVVTMIDHFIAFGPHGKHYVMVFEVLGLCSAELLQDFREGIPIVSVKCIMKDILNSLDFLHERCGIIHMDIKPENVIFSRTKEIDEAENELYQKHYRQKADRKALKEAKRKLSKDGDKLKKNKKKGLKQKIAKLEKKIRAHEELEELPDPGKRSEDFIEDMLECQAATKPYPSAFLCDLGTACWKEDLNKFEVGTRYGRPPEMLVGAKCGPPADIWAAACLCLEFLTGEPFFDPSDEDEEGNPLDPDNEHLKLITEALGRKWPKCILSGPNSRDYFDRTGRLKSEVDDVGIKTILSEQLGWEDGMLDPLLDFILPMLKRDPDQRAVASQMKDHPWLKIEAEDLEQAKEWMQEYVVDAYTPSDSEDEDEDEDSEESFGEDEAEEEINKKLGESILIE